VMMSINYFALYQKVSGDNILLQEFDT
jgi:hypothetical protein